MRGTKAKAMRAYVRKQFPFLSATPLYRQGRYGSRQLVLAEQCQRSLYQAVKRGYKRARTLNLESWRKYNEQ